MTAQPGNPTPSREFARRVCREVRVRTGYARELFDSMSAGSTLEPAELAFARVLVMSVVACRGTLDELIDGVLSKPTDIEADVRDCLRISAYEIFFLGKSPHAAVSQGVELAAKTRPRARGVANFCLRRLAEKRDAFPFGNPLTDIDALARLEGFPYWIARDLAEQWGMDAAHAFMAASNERPPVFFTVNACKAAEDAVLADLDAAGIAHMPGFVQDDTFGPLPVAWCHKLEEPSQVTHPLFRLLAAEGSIIISDAAAQAVAQFALPDVPPQYMLEVGAGRGTKTLLLQSAAIRRYGHQVPLTSIDYLDFKAKLLEDRLRQAGITETRVMTADGTNLDAAFPGESFEAIFIDAPCSGLGTLRRHPEIRWRLKPQDIPALAQVGLRMLESAANHLSPGGQLTYATCTVTPGENQNLVETFLTNAAQQGCSLAPASTDDRSRFTTRLADGRGDAHFAVRLLRDSL